MDQEMHHRFDARGTTGIAVWLPRELHDADNVQEAMTRGYRLSEVVSNAVRNWLMAHGAPGAWVQVAIQQRAGSDAENHREASAFFSMAREPLRASTGNLIAREAMVGRWGADWREGDVVDTVHAVVMSAVRDLGPRWQSVHADVIG
jgi:hypothetical protein